MMRERAARRVRGRDLWVWAVGLFALVAALIGIAALSAISFRQAVGTQVAQAEADALQDRSYAVIIAAEDMYDALQDAEGGERGYVLTRNDVFLEPYSESVEAVEPRLARLEALVEGNEDQARRVAALRRLTELKLAEMAAVVAAMRAGKVADARTEISSGYGRRLMAEIRDQMADLRAAEGKLLAERRTAVRATQAASGASIRRIATVALALLSAAVVAVVGLIFLLRRTRLALVRERYSDIRREALEAAVAERTRELSAANERLLAEARSRETVEDRLRQAQRMEAVGQLTGGIAHDFNNMLAVVIGSLDLLRRRAADDPKIVRLIENAREGADRAATLTARLLAFSRQQSLRPEIVDVNALVGGLREFLRRTLGENVQIETVLASDTPDIYADASELENVIINLGANARDAMPRGGTLTVATSRAELDADRDIDDGTLAAGSYALISVSDTGEGMSEDVRAKVCEPFFTTKPVGRGTGLGLSQVHGFVLQSGGAIDISSTPGEGTRIDILLPEASEVPAAASSGYAPTVELPMARDGETVLVVEDQVQLRNLTLDVLRDLGYGVEAAASATEAVERLGGDGHIDLLFTDIVMPDESGDELARQARELDPDLRLLYTSGYTGAVGDATRFNPPAELLRKPYTVEALAVAVRRALDGGAGKDVARGGVARGASSRS